MLPRGTTYVHARAHGHGARVRVWLGHRALGAAQASAFTGFTHVLESVATASLVGLVSTRLRSPPTRSALRAPTCTSRSQVEVLTLFPSHHLPLLDSSTDQVDVYRNDCIPQQTGSSYKSVGGCCDQAWARPSGMKRERRDPKCGSPP
eukprot:7376209-Prymnesium_polylepis.2